MEYTDIDIVFENCEVYRLPKEAIYEIRLYGMTQSLWTYGNRKSFKLHHSSEFCYMVIKDISKGYVKFPMFKDQNAISLEERIAKWPDITSIDFINNNQSVMQIYVPWNPKKEYNNDWQTVMQDTFGTTIMIKNPNME